MYTWNYYTTGFNFSWAKLEIITEIFQENGIQKQRIGVTAIFERPYVYQQFLHLIAYSQSTTINNRIY